MNQLITQQLPALNGRGTRYCVFEGPTWVSYAQALEMMENSGEFRSFLNDRICHAPYRAVSWETPPITTETVGRPFEFVLVNDPDLETDPEPEVFSSYFVNVSGEIDCQAVPNLGRTALLIVPRGIADPKVYAHLKAFVAGAPAEQVQNLWRTVARTAKEQLSSKRLWVSTAGGGVAWLHVRLEGTPKYYAYGPYANAA